MIRPILEPEVMVARAVRAVPPVPVVRHIDESHAELACGTLSDAIKAARNSNHHGELSVAAALAGMHLAGLLREFDAANAAESLAWDAGAEVEAVELRADRAHAALAECLLNLGLTKAQAERVLS